MLAFCRFALSAMIALTIYEQRTVAQFSADALRSQIRDTFFIGERLPELHTELHRHFRIAPGVRAECVLYTTQYDMRVPAIVYRPDTLPSDGKKLPGLVVVNGHGGDKFSWYAYYAGILYARAGAVVVTFDPTGEGERNPQRKSGTRAHDQIKGDATLARRQAGLLITDVMQAVSLLAQRPEVDANRIGIMGYSLGSFIVSLAGAIDRRPRVSVMVGGGNLDGPDEYWDNSKPMCQGLPYRALDYLGDRPATVYALHALRGATLICNGRDDTVVNMHRTHEPFFEDLQARVARLLGSSANTFDFQIIDRCSHRPLFVTRPVVQWLERQLDLPNWTSQDIDNLPDTRVGDWSTRFDIEMDKGYATEDREAGTRALLDDVPGFNRWDLAVLTETAWRQRKQELIIDSWLANARASELVDLK